MNNTKTGCELHIAVQSDPLELGAIRTDLGEWAQSVDEFGKDHPPKPGERVLFQREDGILYWIGTLKECLRG